jgi:rfaE bifunctional protein nucleotidyltransferase chain/domain
MSRGPLVIVGDALLDRDIDGLARRLCPDAPVPVVEEAGSKERPGGAALAALLAARAANARGAGAGDGGPGGAGEIVLVAAFGDDPASTAVRGMLEDHVTVVPISLNGPLQSKTRVRSGGHTLVRVDTEAGTPGRAGRRATAAIRSAGAVLVSDYGHGVTSSSWVRDALADTAGQAPVVWDPHPKGAAPVPGTTLVTPNESEAAGLTGTGPGDTAGKGVTGADGVTSAAAAAGRLLGRWPARGVSITLGARGALLAQRGQVPLAIPATPVETADPCGAGDQFAAAAAAALRDGALVSEAVTHAVMAASQYLADGGVARLLTGGPGIPAQRGAADWPANWAAGSPAGGREGGVLVAAGGCFDVLHAGHVSMLRAARGLGDRLVVCMNSDASVRRLKGPGRPVNTAADRAAVLRALGCVDDVVIFDEDTPERVLADLRPGIWVKGGDYDGRELPEAAVLRRWGGVVITVPYLDGRSTTQILAGRSGKSLTVR